MGASWGMGRTSRGVWKQRAWTVEEPSQQCLFPTPRGQDTYNEHVATDHEAEVLGEGAHKVHQRWTEVWGPCEHQALRAEEGQGEGQVPSG